MDYFTKNKISGLNRGRDPAEMTKWFGGLDPESRAQVLDTYAAEDADDGGALSLNEAFDGLERRDHVVALKQIHGALQRQGR